EEETKSWKKLINIAVSGAAGMISNHLLFKNQCRPRGSEALPAGIVSSTSSFETRPLWDIPAVRKKHHQQRQVAYVEKVHKA
ncbi:hypothetical protein S83_063188, partial [Arachis hypogaea]